jgi:plastocyanin
MFHSRALPASLLLLLLAAGCGGGGAVGLEAGQAEFSGLTLSADSVTVEVGSAAQLFATPRDQNGQVIPGLPPAAYAIEDTAIAAVDEGIVTGRAVGRTRLFVTLAVNDVTQADTATVVVRPAAGSPPAHPVQTVGTSFVPGVITVAVGDSVTWLFGGATHNVTFDGLAPAGGNIADQTPGARVSRTFDAPGSYTYECTRHSGMTGAVTVQSGQAQQFSAVQLLPAAASLVVGGVLQLSATPLDQAGVPMAGLPAPVFTTTDAAVAAVSPAGLVSAAGPGTARIAARITNGGVTHTDSTTLTITAPAPGATITTPSLTFAPNLVTIQAGETVTWQFVEAVHNVTFLTPVPAGFDIPDQPIGAAVQRSFTSPGQYSYECTRHANMTGTVIVASGQPQVFTSVAIAPPTTSLLVGGTVQLTATPLDQVGVPMSGLPAPVFASSSAAVATVGAGGLVTAVAAGSASISATISSGGTSHAATATVIVTQPAPGGVTVTTTGNNTFSPPSVSIAAGGSVTWQFGNGTHNVTFSGVQPPGGNIPDQSAGAVSRSFPSAGAFAYQCTRHNGMTGTVTVSGGGTPVFSALLVAPQTPFVQTGGTVQLIATPLDQNGATLTGLPAAVWSSLDPQVATVSALGLVSTQAPGTARVVASLTASGVTHADTALVTVGNQANAVITTPGLQFSPDDVSIPPGGVVVWQFSGTTHNVTFEGSAPPGGNIPDTAPGNSVARTFPQIGDYKYECTIHPGLLKGRIRVE